MTGVFCVGCQDLFCQACHTKYLESDACRNEQLICRCQQLEERHKKEGTRAPKHRPLGVFTEVNDPKYLSRLGFDELEKGIKFKCKFP